MRKYISLTLLMVFSILFATAQTAYDALTLSQTELNGTARYMGMAGAFGALGGDASALKDNPAGLGVYRSSEVTATLNPTFTNTTSGWHGSNITENVNNFKLNNFAFVMAIPIWEERTTGLISSNFSFTYNQNRNFSRKMSAFGTATDKSLLDFVADFTNRSTAHFGTKELNFKSTDNYDPYTNERLPWLSVMGYQAFLLNPPTGTNTNWTSVLLKNETVVPKVYISESGSLNDFTFGWGGNFNNNFFLGFNLNVVDATYSLQSDITEDFSADNLNFHLTNYYTQSGSGINLKIGAIYLPTNHLRLGASFHSPTFYNVTEVVDFNILSNHPDLKGNKVYMPKKKYAHEYQITSPFQAHLSAAYLFGQKGLISAEYNFIHYPGMKFHHDGSTKNYEFENSTIEALYNSGHVLKVGAEYKLNQNVALRGGYAHYTTPFDNSYQQGKSLSLNTANTHTGYFNQFERNYISAGVGYRTNTWFFDFAYTLKLANDDYYPYQFLQQKADKTLSNVITPAGVVIDRHQLSLTVGLKM